MKRLGKQRGGKGKVRNWCVKNKRKLTSHLRQRLNPRAILLKVNTTDASTAKAGSRVTHCQHWDRSKPFHNVRLKLQGKMNTALLTSTLTSNPPRTTDLEAHSQSQEKCPGHKLLSSHPKGHTCSTCFRLQESSSHFGKAAQIWRLTPQRKKRKVPPVSTYEDIISIVFLCLEGKTNISSYVSLLSIKSLLLQTC